MKRVVLLGLVAGVLAVGCDKNAVPPDGQIPDVSKVLMAVDECMMSGKTNDAILLLTETMKDKTYVRDRGWLFGNLLNILTMSGQVEQARTLYLDVIGKDDDLTRAGFGVLYSFYQTSGDAVVLEAWCKTLVDAKLPPDLASQAFVWYMGLFHSKGNFDKVLELSAQALKKFDGGTNRRILGDIVNAELGFERWDHATQLLDLIAKDSAAVPELKTFVTIARGDMLVQQKKWEEAEKYFQQVVSGLADGALAGWFNRIVGVAMAANQLDLRDRLCDFVLKNQKDKANARRDASFQWIEVAKARKDAAQIPARLEQLKLLEIPVPVLFSIYLNEFYTVMADAKKEDVLKMMAFGEKILPGLNKAEDIALMQTMTLDGAFVNDDFETSLRVLEKGIAGRDKLWHEMAINKARAHLALKAGKKKEAVDFFRKFMDSVAKWEKPEQDPCTGVFYSKEMCLGLNAKRIADIQASIPDEVSAKASIEESKKFYEKALADVKDDSKEAEVIKKELDALAKWPAKTP